jgi:hypothetical protein
MRNLSFILIILFLASQIKVAGQTKTRGYQLVLGKDTFQTETTIAKDPFDKKSFREYSYLFKNQSQIIKIPRRIDRISVRSRTNSQPSHNKIRIDTVDQIKVNKIIDTISKSELTNIINSEIKIYNRKINLKFDEAQFETIQPNGKSSYTIDLQNPKISEGEHAFESLTALKEGGYFILHTVWFYDGKENRHEIECNIAWLIK